MLENAPFGFPFTEDKLFTGGDVLRTDERISGVHESILYQTARYGDLSYIFKDLPNGNYVVDLHFAEIIFTNGPPGMRVFDISIQEEKVYFLVVRFVFKGIDVFLLGFSIWGSKHRACITGDIGARCLRRSGLQQCVDPQCQHNDI